MTKNGVYDIAKTYKGFRERIAIYKKLKYEHFTLFNKYFYQ